MSSSGGAWRHPTQTDNASWLTCALTTPLCALGLALNEEGFGWTTYGSCLCCRQSQHFESHPTASSFGPGDLVLSVLLVLLLPEILLLLLVLFTSGGSDDAQASAPLQRPGYDELLRRQAEERERYWHGHGG